METSYFNTTHSTKPDLAKYEAKAKDQESRILAFFQRVGKPYRPSELWAVVFSKTVPLTSVRRGLTNLTTAGHLVKTSYQRKGLYGRPEYYWKLAN